MDHVYTTTRTALTLDIGKSTVNKYSRDLEAQGYVFLRDELNHRVFTEHDLVAFRMLMQLSKTMYYDNAVSIVAERYTRENAGEESTELSLPASSVKLNDMGEQLTALMNLVQTMTNSMDSVLSDKVATAAEQIRRTSELQQEELLRRMEDMENAHREEIRELMRTFSSETGKVADVLADLSEQLQQQENKQSWFKRLFRS